MRHNGYSTKRLSAAMPATSRMTHWDIQACASGLVRANWSWNGVILNLVHFLLVADVITTVISTGIQLLLLSLIDHAAFQHHHRHTRQPSALYGSVRCRRHWKGGQSSAGIYNDRICSLCAARAEDLRHMIIGENLTDTLCGELGKRRLLYWMTRILDDDKADRCRGEKGDKQKKEERRTTNRTTKETKARENENGNANEDKWNDERVNTTTETNKSTTQDYQISIYQLPEFLRRQFNAMPETGDTHSTPATPVTVHKVMGMMPRPGQPGALLFDGKKVTKFLKDWSIECEEYGLTDVQKCKRLPKYCTEDIGEVVERLKGYTSEDWTLLQSELKALF